MEPLGAPARRGRAILPGVSINLASVLLVTPWLTNGLMIAGAGT